jgi:hypothetical protein
VPTRPMRVQTRGPEAFVGNGVAQGRSGVADSATQAPDVGLSSPGIPPVAREAIRSGLATPMPAGYARGITPWRLVPASSQRGHGKPQQRPVISQPGRRGQQDGRLLGPRLLVRRRDLAWPSLPAFGRNLRESQQADSSDRPDRQGRHWERLLGPRDFARCDGFSRSSPHLGYKAQRVVVPVEVVYRDARPASLPGSREPTAPAAAPLHTPKLDMDRLTRDIERRLEKRIRIERERRGRL